LAGEANQHLNFERISIQDQLTLIPGDMSDQTSLTHALNVSRPHGVYNLAAQSFVQTSWTQPGLYGSVTALGVTRLLDAFALWIPVIRFYQASSSEMFSRCGKC
jgi:GDPmannose 4,6-dehydratase